ncbi:WhiB family transcriptional regulator [Nocardia sp. NBC_01327]|uniref:WhiB family transcriptional regulator n=1 Tax=Nocardia sp. NBC_01327 TaxID=2903593 RepID=UPI003FA38444
MQQTISKALTTHDTLTEGVEMKQQPMIARSLFNLDELGPQSWREQALCAQTDPDAFFPEVGGSGRTGKRICEGCEVRKQCLDYALAHDQRFGIWGGMTDAERRRYSQQRRVGASTAPHIAPEPPLIRVDQDHRAPR